MGEQEQPQQYVTRLRLQFSDLENQNECLQNRITLLEGETEENDKLLAAIGKINEEQIAELNKEINELESKIQEYQEVISNLREARIKRAEDQHISEATDSSEELEKLEAEKCEILKAYSELQKAIEERQAQSSLLRNEIDEVSRKNSELQSKVSVTVEECDMSNEKMEALQEENLLMKVEFETLKVKMGSHSSEKNSLFDEVADSRQQLKNEAKKLKDQITALLKAHSQTSLEIRKLTKENAKMSDELELAKEQGSIEELKLQLDACKERIQGLEAAQKVWSEEKASAPIVLCQDNETGKFYDNLLKEEREKTKQMWEKYEGVMARYIAAAEDAAAIKHEAVVMESLKLRAEAEIAKLKLQLIKNEEDNHKNNVLKLVVERCPFKEVQNIRKSRFTTGADDPSMRKLLVKKDVDKITRMTSSLEM